MRIVADIHERSGGVPRELRRLALEVREEHLPAGDYVVGENALIERKTTRGLHYSVRDGRFWAQMGKIRRGHGQPYLLITVIRTIDPTDSARWIRRIMLRRASQRSVDRPPYAQRTKRAAHNSPAERALSAAPGIATVTARNLLERFGCLRNVLQASPAELTTVPGVGRSKAGAIHAMGVEGLAIPAQAGIAKRRT
jgi:ERCC4-type nuclease